MKKVVSIFLVLTLIIPSVIYAKEEDKLVPNAKSAILVETTTGKIIYEKNKDEKVSVASLTKMMAQILILEAVENGNLKWDEKIKASANAAGYGGSQIYLEPGEIMTAEELMKGISMASANELAVSIKQSHLLKEEIII